MSKESNDPDNVAQQREWFRDKLSDDLVQLHRVEGREYSGRTKFQAVDIIRTSSYGRCLVLDGRIQSCHGDEFIYHEALVQPAMVSHPGPIDVLIAGGGEGATTRHVLMHPSVRSVVMVDIDSEVVDLCRDKMPEWHAGSFDDPRFELVIGDARKYIEQSDRKFDVILLDIPESLEQGPACMLYTTEFYRHVLACLKPGGVVALQSDNASWGYMNGFPAIVNTLKAVFRVVRPYQVHIPSFGGSWGFSVASQEVDPMGLTPEEVDRHLARRKLTGLGFYDGLAHCHMFSLPKHIRQRIDEERRIITDASPLCI
ncbi:MAG: methyltransferase domain-containing protein [Chloroflexi bacterium]|nr:methyltransferase domain-containing protein [Chloroflexota bacterium]